MTLGVGEGGRLCLGFEVRGRAGNGLAGDGLGLALARRVSKVCRILFSCLWERRWPVDVAAGGGGRTADADFAAVGGEDTAEESEEE
jgi:hypothetical protein